MRDLTGRLTSSLLLMLVLAALLMGSYSAFSQGAPASGGLPAPRSSLHVAQVAPSVTLHGDLVVNAANSPFVITPATAGSSTYVQAGNITVQAGGTLIVRGVSLVFSQFISDIGTLPQRVSHIYTFSVQGSATFDNASLATDTTILNAYSKLTLNVSAGGHLTLLDSTFGFPGWVNVYGVGSVLTLNQSTFTGNALISKLVENQSLVADSEFGPSLSASGGSRVALDASSILNIYKDNVSFTGMPGYPLASPQIYQLTNGAGFTINQFPGPTDSENISRGDSYPSFLGGTISLYYESNTSAISSGSSFTFGNAFALPSINFPAGIGIAQVPLPVAAMTAINAAGPIGWMEATGLFDDPGSIALHLGTTNIPEPVNVSYTSIVLTPTLNYNVSASGVGTVFTAADSLIDLNWNLTPTSASNPGLYPPTPWGSQKLLLNGGASGYLASLSVSHGRVGVFWNSSAVLPDASSHAYLYRWSATPVSASGGIPVQGAQLTAFYSYDSSQSNNATATSLNALSSADPDLASYVNAWDTSHGVLGYGQSGPDGIGMLLLVSSVLDQSTLPDGSFLGGYHVATTLAGNGPESTQWGYASVTPYPSGMTPATADPQAGVFYANYFAQVGISNVNVLIAGVATPTPTIRIGEPLVVEATLTDVGNAPINLFTANLSYALAPPFAPILVAPQQNYTTLAAGGSASVNFTWVVNDSIVGHHGTFTAMFELTSSWNGGTGPNAGVVVSFLNVSIAPAVITLTFTPPHGTLAVSNEYLGTGIVTFNGTGDADISIIATAPNGAEFAVGAAQVPHGQFNASVILSPDMPSGSYSVTANATFNGAYATVIVPNAFSIAGAAAPPTNFLDQKFLGIPLLYWIIIAIAAFGAVVAVLLVLRRSARGKVVECGECGSLIPENAPSCPNCGAEFESDLVRCSRCGSTIPANSAVCPECAAQLLGKPEDEGRDPERQGYNDVVDRFRTEAKKELGDNYSEGAFWDWWKRQPTYLSFSQWKLQQAQGSRAGMSAPPADDAGAAPVAKPPTPPRSGGGASAAPAAAKTAPRAASPTPRAPPAAAPAAAPPPSATPASTAPPAGRDASGASGLKPCSNCGKEIPPEYLVCPFCGAVTQ